MYQGHYLPLYTEDINGRPPYLLSGSKLKYRQPVDHTAEV